MVAEENDQTNPKITPGTDTLDPNIIYVGAGDTDIVQKGKKVRAEVFQRGQGISEQDDFDGNDESAVQLVCEADGGPMGTARLRDMGNQVLKLERMAVLESQRGKGLASKMIVRAIEYARQKGFRKITLDAQLSAKGLYEKHGFTQEGEEFMEVGIPHAKMQLVLS